MHLVKRSTPSSLKLSHITEPLGRCADGAIVDGEEKGELLKNKRSQAKDRSAASAKDRRRLTEARLTTQEDEVCSGPFTEAVPPGST
jgi:hypothetical protein